MRKKLAAEIDPEFRKIITPACPQTEPLVKANQDKLADLAPRLREKEIGERAELLMLMGHHEADTLLKAANLE